MINALLIANRGEIACRIMRSAKQMGIRTIAVYSSADQHALHVQQADEAYLIGAAASAESYLCIDKIIAVAKQANADAIHPGYGFLSENAEFAEQCAAHGIIFVGPAPQALRDMGEKHTAKQIAEQAGVPVLPGYHGQEQDEQTLRQAAETIGYPVLLKASAGGGGKGMRIVQQASEFTDALAGAKREAKASFGNDFMLIEKYLVNPRHIEIQLLADSHGHTIHVFERDCSIQRRQQKIIEEAPAPQFSAKLRARMGQAAVDLARSINYVSAGTIEFLLDSEHNFYFMEMNTRLQVEHPVSEMISGLDLVAWQLRIAAGEKLDVELTEPYGHAIEARIYAEDPYNQFLPCIGDIHYLHAPQDSDYVRVESGVQSGDAVSAFYDPMLAKLICWGADREQAITHMQQALSEYRLLGITSNIDFLSHLIRLPAFKQGDVHTHFIPLHDAELFQQQRTLAPQSLAALTLAISLQQQPAYTPLSNDYFSPWDDGDAWQANLPATQQFTFTYHEQALTVTLRHLAHDYEFSYQQQTLPLQGEFCASGLSFRLGEHAHHADIYQLEDNWHIYDAHGHHIVNYRDVDNYQARINSGDASLSSPMPGTITAIMVKAGEQVRKGSPLVVLEAMKMEHTIYAPCDGNITALPFAIGDMVNEGVELVEFVNEDKD